jgi:hypothetical protein
LAGTDEKSDENTGIQTGPYTAGSKLFTAVKINAKLIDCCSNFDMLFTSVWKLG